MAEEVAALNVRLEATVQRFEQQIQRARRTLDRQGKRMEKRVDSIDQRFSRFGARFGRQLMAGLGAFAGAQGIRRLAGSFQETLDRLDDIAKQADKLGLTVEALQELRFAAERSGVAVSTFDMAFQRFTRRAAEAANGTGEAEAALKELNIQLRDSEGRMRPMEALFDDVADALANVESQSDRVRLAFKLFDSEGVAVLNMLQNGSEAMKRMREEARELGIVLKEDVVRDAVKMKDELSEVFQVIGRNWDRLMLRMARNFVQIFDLMPKDIDQQMIETMDELVNKQEQLRKAQEMTGRTGEGTPLFEDVEQLKERVRVLRQLQKTEEAARRMANEPIDTSGVGAGAGGGSRQEEAATIRDILDAMEEEILALDRRAEAMRLNEAETAEFLATQRALDKARELGIDLDEKAANSNRTNRELIRLWAEDVARATERVESLREALDEKAEAERQAARASEEHQRQMQRVADAFVDAALNARSLDDALQSLSRALMSILSQQVSGAFSSLIGSALSGLMGGGASFPTSVHGANLSGLTFARGAAFERGNVVPFARGGVVDKPTVFPMANGVGLMGEDGPEAVLPLRRGPGGKLGVAGGGSNVQVQVFAPPGSEVREEREQTPDGQRIKVFIDQAVGEALNTPGSATSRALSTQFGARPVTRRR